MYLVSSDCAIPCQRSVQAYNSSPTDLVEKDVLAVAPLGRKVLEVAILVDTVLLAELLPELAADCASVSVFWSVPRGTQE